jgi:hypothetical protein
MGELPMFSQAPRRVVAQLDVIPFVFESPPGELDWVLCNQCRARLDICQPDIQSPARLLGICSGCLRWYLILMEPGLTSALMVQMPENESFQVAWESHAGSEGNG